MNPGAILPAVQAGFAQASDNNAVSRNQAWKGQDEQWQGRDPPRNETQPSRPWLGVSKL